MENNHTPPTTTSSYSSTMISVFSFSVTTTTQPFTAPSSLSSRLRHNFQLHQRALLGQTRNLHASAHGIRFLEIFGPYLIHFAEIGHFHDVYSSADDFVQGGVCGEEAGFYVEDCAMLGVGGVRMGGGSRGGGGGGIGGMRDDRYRRRGWMNE